MGHVCLREHTYCPDSIIPLTLSPSVFPCQCHSTIAQYFSVPLVSFHQCSLLLWSPVSTIPQFFSTLCSAGSVIPSFLSTFVFPCQHHSTSSQYFFVNLSVLHSTSSQYFFVNLSVLFHHFSVLACFPVSIIPSFLSTSLSLFQHNSTSAQYSCVFCRPFYPYPILLCSSSSIIPPVLTTSV